MNLPELTTNLIAVSADAEADARRTIGLLVVAGMVALILKGLLIARWVKARRQRKRTQAAIDSAGRP